MLTQRVICILSAVSLWTHIAFSIRLVAAAANLSLLELAASWFMYRCARHRNLLASLFSARRARTGVVAWIMGMLQAADEKRWGWFVAVLVAWRDWLARLCASATYNRR